ncbi:MAG: hypothetical protein JWP74_2638 [Marmoricola sp.]|nr:hypothetical protein [Marmoricola sp.]
MRTNRLTSKRTFASIAALALLAAPLAACGSKSSDGPPKAVAVIQTLTGKSTAIKLDSGFVKALGSLKLTPGVVGRAKLRNGSLIFPITGGNVSVFKPGEVSPYVIGQIQHVGSGLSLTAGKTVVKLTNFNVDPGVSRVYGDVTVNGKLAVQDAFLFQLDGRTLKKLQVAPKHAVLTGTKVEISPVAAGLLDSTFGTKAVKGGLLVGIATITVNLP